MPFEDHSLLNIYNIKNNSQKKIVTTLITAYHNTGLEH